MDGELEESLGVAPFELYPLFRGSLGGDIFDDEYHQVHRLSEATTLSAGW